MSRILWLLTVITLFLALDCGQSFAQPAIVSTEIKVQPTGELVILNLSGPIGQQKTIYVERAGSRSAGYKQRFIRAVSLAEELQ